MKKSILILSLSIFLFFSINYVLGITTSTVETSVVSSISTKQNAFVGIDATTPITVNDISVDYTNRVLTISKTPFSFFVDGAGTITKYTKTGGVTFPAFTDTSGTWYFYFNTSGVAVATTTAWTNFDVLSPVYRIYWNATKTGAEKSISEGFEAHLNTISAADHTWKHQYGAIYREGLTLYSNAISSGAPNASGLNTCVGFSNGTVMDDNLDYTITNSKLSTKFNQDLGTTTAAGITTANGAKMTIIRKVSSLGENIASTTFPFAWDVATNRPEYIIADGTRTKVDANYYFVYYVFAFQDPRAGQGVRLVSDIVQYADIASARLSSWGTLKNSYSALNDKELRPLYRLIFEYKSSYDAAVKYSALREVLDIRLVNYVNTL